MADKPLLFTGPMVRALLDGRKTQTRRVLKPKAVASLTCAHRVESIGGHPLAREYDRSWPIITGFTVGDRIWVRETWRPYGLDTPLSECRDHEDIMCRADANEAEVAVLNWKPSIFMPRWASRLTLIVTDVRVERLQAISREDAIAEGLIQFAHASPMARDAGCDWTYEGEPEGLCGSPISAYGALWDRINGAGAWYENPWVCAVTFTVHKHNIDQMGKAA